MGRDTNCGEKVVYNCSLCKAYQWNDPNCQTCQIYQLKKQIRDLKAENSFLRKDQDQQFNLTKHLFWKYGKQYLETPYTTPMNQDNLYFVTITFDPNRFNNLGTDAAAEETYILHQLALATKDELVIELIGCFELQNNGTTHAHAHIRTYQPIELQQTLKKKFTNNMRNHRAVDIQTARTSEKGMDYINKLQEGKGTENKTWFTINSIKVDQSEEVSLLNIGVCGIVGTESQSVPDGYLCSGTSTLLDSGDGLLRETLRREKQNKNILKISKKYSKKIISNV